MVLDEADEMLDLGFQPSVEKILSYLPEEDRPEHAVLTTMLARSLRWHAST